MLSISKEQLALLPTVNYEGTCRLIESASSARDAVRYLMKQEEIGFDTETKPSFKKGQRHKVALLQLATDDECFLFRLNKTGITDSIKKLLETEDVVKIGLSTNDDFNSLRRLEPTLSPAGFLELQSWVKDFDIADNSLSRIYGIIFGQRISKAQRLTNWEADELTQAQQHYAALDAWACLTIHRHLSDGLFHPELSPYKIIETSTEINSNSDENNS